LSDRVSEIESRLVAVNRQHVVLTNKLSVTPTTLKSK